MTEIKRVFHAKSKAITVGRRYDMTVDKEGTQLYKCDVFVGDTRIGYIESVKNPKLSLLQPNKRTLTFVVKGYEGYIPTPYLLNGADRTVAIDQLVQDWKHLKRIKPEEMAEISKCKTPDPMPYARMSLPSERYRTHENHQFGGRMTKFAPRPGYCQEWAGYHK